MIISSISWNINPEIFPLGSLSIRWYGLFFAASFYLGYLILSKFFKLEGESEEFLDKLVVYAAVGTILGARLGHCFFYEPQYYLDNPGEIIKIWHGGLASHGAAVGILVALFLLSKKFKKSFLWILDRVVVVTALAGFFIRMGNLMNSEIYGYETNLPWGFVFVRAGESAPKHPTQIYEALTYLIIFIILIKLYYRTPNGKIKEGLLSGLFLVLVFGARFFIEFIKEIQVEMELGWTLKMGQILSIPFVIIGIILILRAIKSPSLNEMPSGVEGS